MRMNYRWSQLILLIGLLSGLIFAQRDEVSLKLRYQSGQTLNYKVNVEGSVNLISEIGVASDLKFKGELNQEQVVKEVADDGTATLLVTVNGKIVLSTPTESAQPNEQKVTATKILMKLTSDGRVVEVKPLKEEGEKSPEQFEVLQDPFQALTLSATLWALLQPNLPPRPLKVGETWELTGTVPVPLQGGQTASAKMSSKGKLVSVERKEGTEQAVVEIQSEVPEIGELVSKMLPLKEMGINLQAKGGTKANTKHYFDLAKGLISRSEVNTETKMNVVIQMPENVGGGVMSIQAQTQIKSVVELVSVKP
ncbi:MAG: hypothetical protein NZ805_00170 [Armatimonadetes bacterium]|nr:hypothetical protein [Armatimonadota bacterium]MDW8026932.1 hypothetical protein [Armatimonadota bacterium]